MTDLSRLKVCFLAGTLGQGGAERQLYYVLRTLKAAGTELHLLTLTRGEFWEEHIRALGVPVTWVGESASRLARLQRIVQFLRRVRPDVVQSQHFYTNLYVAAAARLLDLREVGAIRNDVLSEVKSLGRTQGRMSLHAPRLLAANSQNAIHNAAQYGVSTDRLYLLNNVVDTRLFHVAKKAKGDQICLLTIGRMVPQKRLDCFIDALAAVRHRTKRDVRGILVGDSPPGGSLRSDLEQRACDAGLLPNLLDFRGRVSNVSDVYREADIFVLTSAWEGTPNVVLEAMASGLPVIATRVGGVPEIVQDDETGYLVEPGDLDTLIDRLLRLVDDDALCKRQGTQARTYVESHHSLERLPHQLKNLYHAALS